MIQRRLTCQTLNESVLSDACACIREMTETIEDGTEIILEKGSYELRTDYAVEKTCYISNNDSGVKRIAFYLEGKNHIVIDGNMSLLNGIGRILPFYIKNCKDITLKNFIIDYKRPFTTQGEVLASTKTSVILKIDTEKYPYVVKQHTLRFVGEDYDCDFVHGMLAFEKEGKRPVSGVFDNSVRASLVARELEKGIVEIYYDFRMQPKEGEILTIKHEPRFAPAITIDDCERVTMENIIIRHAGTMGIVAQSSSDLTISNVTIAPDPASDQVFSINADATHFVNCSGLVLIENSKFEGMFDDVLNVHGNYVLIKKVMDDHHAIVYIPHEQQQGYIPFKENDVADICEQLTMECVGSAVITGVKQINARYYELSYTSEFSFMEGKTYCLDSRDRYPRVIFRNNVCGKNRARGLILTSTKETIVENNIIDSEGTCVMVNSDMSNWFESGAISNLVIRNNVLRRHNDANWGFAIVDVTPHMDKQVEGTYFHQRVSVTDNDIYVNQTPLAYVYSLKELEVKGNRVYLASDEINKEQLTVASNTKSVVVEGNEVSVKAYPKEERV